MVIIKDEEEIQKILSQKHPQKGINCVGVKPVIIKEINEIEDGIYFLVVVYNSETGIQLIKMPGGTNRLGEVKAFSHFKKRWEDETAEKIEGAEPVFFLDDMGHKKIFYAVLKSIPNGPRKKGKDNRTSPPVLMHIKFLFEKNAVVNEHTKLALIESIKYFYENIPDFRNAFVKYKYAENLNIKLF